MPREERIYSVFIVVSDFIVFFFFGQERDATMLTYGTFTQGCSSDVDPEVTIETELLQGS